MKLCVMHVIPSLGIRRLNEELINRYEDTNVPKINLKGNEPLEEYLINNNYDLIERQKNIV